MLKPRTPVQIQPRIRGRAREGNHLDGALGSASQSAPRRRLQGTPWWKGPVSIRRLEDPVEAGADVGLDPRGREGFF